jgi:pimeloyl-ACP methyl ester carboxylesterase
MRMITTLASLWLGAVASADVLRWGGMVDPPQAPEGFVVFEIDTEAETATLTALPWGLPPTELRHNTQFWTGVISGQQLSVQGTGEAGGDFQAEMIKIGPVGPVAATLTWMPRLRSVDGVRAYAGMLDMPGMELDITIRLANVGDATQAEIDIPLQVIDALPIRLTAQTADTFTFTLDGPMPATLVLTESDEGLTGSFSQGPMHMDVSLKPAAVEVVPQRPQLPQPPFPYTQHEILVEHTDGHWLAGTLTVPPGDGPFPAAVLISGSGAQDRDESLMGHKPFLVLADHLSRNGIAVMRYDDRGVGGSKAGNSDLSDDTSADFATDALLMAKHIAARDDIDAGRIGLIGHSEGGLIGPIAAAAEPDVVAYLVLLSGPGVPGSEILIAQVEALLLAAGESPEAVGRVKAAQQKVIAAVMSDAPRDALVQHMRSLVQAQFAMADQQSDGEADDAIVQMGVAHMDSVWMRWFMKTDPADYLAKVTCPVLALNGTLDLQVPVDQNLPVIERVVRESGGDITTHRLEGLNHLFQPATKGTVDEYPRIETTFDPAAMELISNWIRSRMEVAQ